MGLIERLRSGAEQFLAEQRELDRSIKIGFDYHLSSTFGGDNGLDDIFRITAAVKKAKDLVLDSDKNIEIYYGCPTGLAYIEHSFTLSGPDTQSVERALDLFIRTAGAPDFIDQNFELAEKVLANFGKTLKRKPSGGFVGKHVVDAKSSVR